MDQGVYFENWLYNFRPRTALDLDDKISALEFFQQHQPKVSEWCHTRNLFTCTVDDVMTPNMLPYSSFLWQWCSRECVKAGQNAKDDKADRYRLLLDNIRLPLGGRVQNDMIECWRHVLGPRYIDFNFSRMP